MIAADLGSHISTTSEPPSKLGGNVDINIAMIKFASVFSLLRPELVFAPAYPDFVVNYEGKTYPSPTAPDETITWKVAKREPGSVSGKPFQNAVREVAPRLRETTADPYSESRQIMDPANGFEVYGQTMDNLIQFDVWSKTNKQVVELLEWFEDTLFSLRKLTQEIGIIKYYFWDRTDDVVLFQYRNGLQFRSTRYYFRTEKIHVIRIPIIEEIRHYLAVLGSSEVARQTIN